MYLHYSIYGLRIAFREELPGVISIPDTYPPDVVIESNLTTVVSLDADYRTLYTSPERDAADTPTVVCLVSWDGELYCFRYYDGVAFYFNRLGTRIWIENPHSFPTDYVAIYLLGPILGFVLRLRGTVSLHASAVEMGGRALALVGPGGRGKSTTAAAPVNYGCAVLSEDVVPLSDAGGVFRVQSGYPCLRLWPESVNALFGTPEALPKLTPTWEKRGLLLDTSSEAFRTDPVRLAVIYLLGERSGQRDAPLVESVTQTNALVSLIANTYTNYALDAAMRAREFELLSRLIRVVPVKRVIPTTTIECLPQLCQQICTDFTSLNDR